MMADMPDVERPSAAPSLHQPPVPQPQCRSGQSPIDRFAILVVTVEHAVSTAFCANIPLRYRVAASCDTTATA